MGKISDAWLILIGKKKRSKLVYNSEDLNENEKLAAAHAEIGYLKGVLLKQEAEKNLERESKKDEEEEKERIKELNEQKKKLDKEEINPVDLFRIMKYVEKSRKHPKKYKPIYFTTFDEQKIIGPLQSFALMPDGGFGCVSNNEIIWASKDINNVFWWVAGLGNSIRSKSIPLCRDYKGKFIPNIQTMEMSELVRSSDGKFRINRFNKRPIKEMLMEDKEQIGDLHSELESAESTISEQQKEITEKEREAKLHLSRADKAQSELSMALNKVQEIEMAHGQMARQIMTLNNIKTTSEDLIDTFERILNKNMDRLDNAMSGPAREREWEDLKNKLNQLH